MVSTTQTLSLFYSLLQTLIFLSEYPTWLYQIATNTVSCVCTVSVSLFVAKQLHSIRQWNALWLSACSLASKCQQTGTTTFSDEIGNVEAILNSIFSSIAPQTQQKKRRILTFLPKCMGAAILKIGVDFYLQRQESVLQVDTSRGSSSWTRINQCECKRNHWGGPGPDRAGIGSINVNVNGTTEVGLVRTEMGSDQSMWM